MANNCVVAGRVICGGTPLASVPVQVRLLNNNRGATPFNANTTTEANGGWALAFDVGLDLAEIGFAEITVVCPNGPPRRYLRRAEVSAAGTASQTFRVMLENVGTDLLSRVLGFPILTPILSTDFVTIVINGGTVDCCPQTAGGGTGSTGGGGIGTGGGTGTGSPGGSIPGGGGTGPGGGVGGTGTGPAGGLTPEELLRRMEEAARRAEEAARRAEEERRRAEEERRRAEEERRRAEDAARRAEEDRRRAEQARRDAEAALEEARRLNRVRTRVCFDLAGKARSSGRAGVTVAGENVVVDVSPGQTAGDILGAIAAALRSRGFEVEGPRVEPGTGETVICVIADAAGRDPQGGGIGTIDIVGLSRFSAKRQQYRAALAMGGARGDVRVALGESPSAAVSAIELAYTTGRGANLQTLLLEGTPGLTPSDWADRVLAAVDGAVVGIGSGPGGQPVLSVGALLDDDVRIEAIAVIGGEQTAESGISVGLSNLPLLPPRQEIQSPPKGKRPPRARY